MDRNQCIEEGGRWNQATKNCIGIDSAAIALHPGDSTRHYHWEISYPEITRQNQVLYEALTGYAEAQKEDFLSAFEGDSLPESATYPWELQLTFTVEDSTQRFISILGTGYRYTGGAHGMPFHKTVNYRHSTGHIVQLPELLADSAALEPISRYAQRALAKQFMANREQPVMGNTTAEQYLQQQGDWIKQGTELAYSNYKHFLLQPNGIRFIFEAYQVAPYAVGTPGVNVPISVFADYLSPLGDSLFATTEEKQSL